MQITHIKLLERQFDDQGRCLAKVRIAGSDGQSIQIDCNVPAHQSGRRGMLNGLISQDIIRQLLRMPEYRNAAPSALEFAMPEQPNRRKIVLPKR